MGGPARRRAPGLVIAGLALAVVPSAALADDPVAAPGALGFSPDAVHWTQSLPAPLFDPDVRWVPGDVRTARFFVRNEYPDRGDLAIVVERTERDDLLRSGHLLVSARAGNQPWSTVSSGGLQELLDTDDLASGDPVRIEVRVRMGDSAPNGTMVLSTDLDLRVRLTEATVTPVVADGSQSIGEAKSGGRDDEDTAVAADGADLPSTGSDVPPWLPPLGLVLLGTGAYLVVRRRDTGTEPVDACADLEERHHLA